MKTLPACRALRRCSALVLTGLGLVSTAFAYWPPFQTVQASKTVELWTTVLEFRAKDPVKNAWLTNTLTFPGSAGSYWEVSEPKVRDGVAMWNAQRFGAAPRTALGFLAYDPGRTNWVTYDKLLDGTWLVKNAAAAGVGTWTAEPDTLGALRVGFVVYDPRKPAWVEQEEILVSEGFNYWTGASVVGDGLGGWSATLVGGTKLAAGWAVYDPAKSAWVTGRDNVVAPQGGQASAAIQDFTVTYDLAGITGTAGYDPGTGKWYNGPTKALAAFAAGPLLGKPTNRVWFTDLSLGATTWHWDFDDGAPSVQRSPMHDFTRTNVFLVVQSVTGPAGEDEESLKVTTDFVPPTGTVRVNQGAEFVNSRNVTLNLTFQDNAGGTNFSTRLRNAGAAWGTWLPFASNVSWTLTAGTGMKTVQAQFRDDSGNLSVTNTASTTIDQTAPTGSIVVDGGAASTASGTVTLTLSANDQGGAGVSNMHFSNDAETWSDWQDYATTAGWELSAGDGPKTIHVRFRDRAGNVSPAYSDSILRQTPINMPTFTEKPGSRTVNAGGQVSFHAAADGDPPLHYQWRRNKTNLLESSRLTGVTTNTLNLIDVLPTDAGNFTIVVSNNGGAITSSPPAVLAVVIPTLTATGHSPATGSTLTLTGAPGTWFVMEGSTNLVSVNPPAWTPLATNAVGPDGLWPFVDPAATNLDFRFYRATGFE